MTCEKCKDLSAKVDALAVQLRDLERYLSDDYATWLANGMAAAKVEAVCCVCGKVGGPRGDATEARDGKWYCYAHWPAPAKAEPLLPNPTCLQCGDTPSCGDGSWRWAGNNWQHRCRGMHPQCGHFDIANDAGPATPPSPQLPPGVEVVQMSDGAWDVRTKTHYFASTLVWSDIPPDDEYGSFHSRDDAIAAALKAPPPPVAGPPATPATGDGLEAKIGDKRVSPPHERIQDELCLYCGGDCHWIKGTNAGYYCVGGCDNKIVTHRKIDEQDEATKAWKRFIAEWCEFPHPAGTCAEAQFSREQEIYREKLRYDKACDRNAELMDENFALAEKLKKIQEITGAKR